MKKNNIYINTAQRAEGKADMLIARAENEYNTVVFDFEVGQVAKKVKSYPFVFYSSNGASAVVDAVVCLSNYSDKFTVKAEINGISAEKNCEITIAGIARLCFKAENVVKGANVCTFTLIAQQEIPYWTDSCAVTVSGKGVCDKSVCAAVLANGVYYFAENGMVIRKDEDGSTPVRTFNRTVDCMSAAIIDGNETCFVLSGGRLYVLTESSETEIARSVQWFSVTAIGNAVTVYAVQRGMLFKGDYDGGVIKLTSLPLAPYSRIKRVAACSDAEGNTALFAETGGKTKLFTSANGVFTETATLPLTGISGGVFSGGKVEAVALQKGTAVCAAISADGTVTSEVIGKADAAVLNGSGQCITLNGGAVGTITPSFGIAH